MQHDVFANPASKSRAAFPFLVLLQADLATDGEFRVVAPLANDAGLSGAGGKLLPAVSYGGGTYRVVLDMITSVPKAALRAPLGSVAAHRDEITRGLDWLFTGV
ncbi:MAG TPA: CcdB family protein [Acetobacteraceae bacterium]|nr:CcdB family protein [Acetobacteraceae bacterium]